jgi:hypothetical protein
MTDNARAGRLYIAHIRTAVATNDTADGRQANRRVDIAVMANEKLKKAAQDQAKK